MHVRKKRGVGILTGFCFARGLFAFRILTPKAYDAIEFVLAYADQPVVYINWGQVVSKRGIDSRQIRERSHPDLVSAQSDHCRSGSALERQESNQSISITMQKVDYPQRCRSVATPGFQEHVEVLFGLHSPQQFVKRLDIILTNASVR